MAAGDIALTTPKSIPNLPLGEVHINILPTAFATFTFYEVDATGPSHTVRIVNATLSGVTGFNYSAGVFTDNVARTTLTNYLTTILGVLFIGDASTLNQRKTAVVQRLITDGVITVPGTVG
jgi:hypothetical protein